MQQVIDPKDGRQRDETPEEVKARTARMVTISASVPAATKEALERRAAEEERTIGVVIRRLVEAGLGIRQL